MLLVSGITTIMQSFFGTRLPLVQGSSFVYLAPALVIINSEEFRNLSENVSLHFLPMSCTMSVNRLKQVLLSSKHKVMLIICRSHCFSELLSVSTCIVRLLIC